MGVLVWIVLLIVPALTAVLNLRRVPTFNFSYTSDGILRINGFIWPSSH